MRKITSAESLEKKRERNNLILAVILIGVMVFGTLGYALEGKESENNKNLNYNGFEFASQGDFWTTQIGDSTFIFKYNPTQVDKIEENFKTLNDYSQKPLYIYSENEIASLEIIRNMGMNVLRIQKACLNETSCEKDLPVKTCEDNFIIIREKDISKVQQEKNCVFIEGKKEDLPKLSDEFLFKILGIN